MPLRLLSWNLRRLTDSWKALADDATVDVALVQEACAPPEGAPFMVHPAREAVWRTAGWTNLPARTAIAHRAERVALRPRATVALGDALRDRAVPVSREGTLTVADLEWGGEVLTLVSAYAAWEGPSDGSRWLFADASAHRLISDLSSLVSTERLHRVIVAGDFNLLRGYGEGASAYWQARYATVFARMEAIGVPFVGPQYPDGRRADPWPSELPPTSLNVPTFHSTRQKPAEASRQLDYVFASSALHPRLTVRALNEVESWGPSDHCRVEILLRERA